jgi:hypothetical protein
MTKIQLSKFTEAWILERIWQLIYLILIPILPDIGHLNEGA